MTAPNPDSELDDILTSHLQDIRAGHDGKLEAKLHQWSAKRELMARKDTIAKIPDRRPYVAIKRMLKKELEEL